MSKDDDNPAKFDQWAILEIMGHQTYAGRDVTLPDAARESAAGLAEFQAQPTRDVHIASC